jgi:hypothetical protein
LNAQGQRESWENATKKVEEFGDELIAEMARTADAIGQESHTNL